MNQPVVEPPPDPSAPPSGRSPEAEPAPAVFVSGRPERTFRIGRLLAVIVGVIVAMGVAAAIIDIVVLCGFMPAVFCLAPI